jgi:hypothetical protein
MEDFYTMETVRDQLIPIGTLGDTHGLGTFPSNWEYCPCIVEKTCTRLKREMCPDPVYLSMYIRTPNISIPIVVEILFFRNTHKGYIRANNMKLNKLIKDNIINGKALKKVSLRTHKK